MRDESLSKVTVSKDATILEAMRAINAIGSRFAIVVDEQRQLVGILTDGDIRRALINNHSINEPVEAIANKRTIVARDTQTKEQMLALASPKIAFVPIVDASNKVVGIVSYEDKTIALDAKSKVVCVVGLGFVGLTLSLVLADLGFEVIGFDSHSDRVESLNQGSAPFHERNLESLLQRHIGKDFLVTGSLEDVSADTYIISVGTPIDEADKRPRNEAIQAAARSISEVLKPGNLVVLRSTVTVGATRGIVMPILDESGLIAGKDYFLAFAPERTVEGRAIQELRELPQIIGGFDTKSSMLANRLFRELTSTIINVDSLESAEMVKILNNTFRDVKFAFANQMALVCKELGLDMSKLVQAANHEYTRDPIPSPSPGVGGACLSKDPYILVDSCKQLATQPGLVSAARQVNESVPGLLASELHRKLQERGKEPHAIKIFVAGFAFKGNPETSDIRNSTTLDFIAELNRLGYGKKSIYGYDPIVASEELEPFAHPVDELAEGFRNADAICVMNNHKSFQAWNLSELILASNRNLVLLDSWRLFNASDLEGLEAATYIGIGC